MALRHKLVSRYTSLVLVNREPSRPLDLPLKKQAVPANLPAGMTAQKIFGSMPQTATPASLNLMMGLVALLVLLVLRRHWA